MLVAVPAALFAASATLFVAVADPGAPSTSEPARESAPLVKNVAQRGGSDVETVATAPVS